MKNKKIIIPSILTIIMLVILYFVNESQTGQKAFDMGILTLMFILPITYLLMGMIIQSSNTNLKYVYILISAISTVIFGYLWGEDLNILYVIICILPTFVGMTIYEIIKTIKQCIAAKKDLSKKEKINIDKIPIITTIILIFIYIVFI